VILLARRDWGARMPTRPPVTVPADVRHGVVIHWNGPPLGTKGADDEQAKLRGIQKYHQGKGWPDIAYSYAVGQSGTAYELRGIWNQFANGDDVVGPDDGADSRWFTVLWLGGEGETPTAEAMATLAELVAAIRGFGAGRRVLPHSDFKRKTCPGPELTTWCRWVDGQDVEDDMTPQQAQQLEQIWGGLFGAVGGGPAVTRIQEIHEGVRAVRCEGGTGGGALSDADVERVAVRVADLLAQRLGS
jgi:hypothetical protein